jgi:hypothetical protein
MALFLFSLGDSRTNDDRGSVRKLVFARARAVNRTSAQSAGRGHGKYLSRCRFARTAGRSLTATFGEIAGSLPAARDATRGAGLTIERRVPKSRVDRIAGKALVPRQVANTTVIGDSLSSTALSL